MRPRMMRLVPGSRSLSLPSRMAPAIVETLASSAGSMPRTIAPLIEGARLSIASVSRNGAAPVRPGAPCSSRIFARQSAIAAPPAVNVACAERLSNRLRNSGPKSVHDRQHRDQREHAQRDAEQRYPGDERDEKTVLARQRITQAHVDWNGLEHSRRLNHSPFAPGARLERAQEVQS